MLNPGKCQRNPCFQKPGVWISQRVSSTPGNPQWNEQFVHLLCFQRLFFGTPRVYSGDKLINITLTVLTAQTHRPQQHGHSHKQNQLLADSTPVLFLRRQRAPCLNLMLVNSFKPVTVPRGLLSFNSCGKIIILFPRFLASQLIFPRLHSEKACKFTRTARISTWSENYCRSTTSNNGKCLWVRHDARR